MTSPTFRTLALAGALLLTQGATAQSTPTDTPMPRGAAEQQNPDNTRNNRAGRPGEEPTADQQENDATDLHLTQQIRGSVMADKTLSTSAHNVRIVSAGGLVTLKGVVKTEAERRSIADKAVAVAGSARVVNELQIAPR